MLKEQKGITLVALVITIIVLLILAGVTIAALSGPNGILSNASQATEDTAVSEAKEAVTTAINTILTNQYAEVATDNTLNQATIISVVNANYGAGKAVANGTNKIDYTTGGYKITLTLSSDFMKIEGEPVVAKAD